MTRSSMDDLITRTRTLIADPNSVAFTDQQVQDVLDEWRTEQRQMLLQGMPKFVPGGQILFLDFYADVPNWEDDVVLQDPSWTVITATTAEPIPGHWYFSVQPNGLAVRATGKTYDIHGAAADLLDAWAAQVKLDFGVRTDRDQYLRKEKFDMITALAMKQRALAGHRSSRITQTDMQPDHIGGGVTYPSYEAEDMR